MNRKIKLLVWLLLSGVTGQALADYPIVSYRYLADPGALVYNGRVYIYCSNDDDNELDGGYSMHTIVCVSSSDLKNWTDHGVVFRVPEGASWAQNSWAPSPAARNGKFYLYFGNGGSNIGVAVSDSPTGPFSDPNNNAIVNSGTPGVLPADGIWIFDPMTFIDDDGQAYMYFGGNGENNLRIVKLNEDMISLDGAATQFYVPYFFEAAWMHKYNDTYYFSYSTNPGNGIRIDYMTSDKPTSDFTYGGILSPQPPNNNNNNHHATFKINDQWYQAYHNRIVAQQAGIPTTYKRNLAVDQFSHKEDGSIETMVNTVDGVQQIGYLNPFVRVEAETMNDQNGIETQAHAEGGMFVTSIAGMDWIKVRGVDFGSSGAAAFTASVASAPKIGSSPGESIEIRLDAVAGTLIGAVPISNTGGPDVWKDETIAVEEASGVHDVYFLLKGENSDNLFNFDYWNFIQKTEVHDLIAINAFVDASKIDTVTGYNQTAIKVTAIYSDGTSEDVTTQTSFNFDQENIISVTDSIIKGLNYGTVAITASYNDSADNVIVVVKNRESELTVSQIYSDADDIGLFTGSSTSITITAEFADGHIEDVTEYATYDNPAPEIVTIENGIIKALTEGEVDITISYQGQIGEEKSTTIHVAVTAGSAVWLEAECAEVGGNWDIVDNTQASNSNYVTVRSGVQSLDNAPTGSENLIEIPFLLNTQGSFAIYARLNCPSYDDDSFWIKVDDGSFTLHNGLVTSGWEWIKFDDYELIEGEHTLTIGYREDGALMDKIVISNYGTAPDGMGEEADNLCDPTGLLDLVEIPKKYSLEQNYPNPFNPVTKIKFSVPASEKVTIDIYNSSGQQILNLLNEKISIGSHSLIFDGKYLSSGIYYCRMAAGSFVETRKMLLIK